MPPVTGPSEPADPAPPPVPTGGTLDEQRRGYLAAVFAVLQPRWDRLRARATVMLPAMHPANQRSRATELSARLDRQGRIKQVVVVKSSGFGPYDESALATLKHVRRMPNLPPLLRRGHPELRWTLHRDQRSCGVQYARLVLHPLSPVEAFADALEAGKNEAAYKLIARAPGDAAMLLLLARRGLAARGDDLARRRALAVAPGALLVSLLAGEISSPTWEAVVRQLKKRKATGALSKELERISAVPHSAGKVQRVALLVQALTELEARAPDPVIKALVEASQPAMVLAAAPGVRDPAMLDRAMARFARQPRVAGVLAVYRLALGTSSAATAVFDTCWTGQARMAMLGALGRRPSVTLTPRVEALVRSTANPPELRIRAIQILGSLKSATSPFYVALLSKRPDVRLAAIEALSRRKDNATSISYRLSVVAKWGGPVGAAALSAVARFGIKRFLSDTRYLIKVQAMKLRPQVIAQMGNFGEPAVPYLAEQLNGKSEPMRRAAAAALSQIKGAAARKALAPYLEKNPPPASSVSTTSELARLLERVMKLKR